MLKKLLPIAIVAILFANCTKFDVDESNFSNRDRMNMLAINDPLIWNSMSDQFIELDTTLGMKASNGMKKSYEYPKKGYYYTIFEDLFPSQGDYDFNDVMLQSKLKIRSGWREMSGTVSTTMYHRGGTLDTRIGLMFYTIDRDGTYTRIDNKQLVINGEKVEGDDPWSMELPAYGEDFNVEFDVNDLDRYAKGIWIGWFIIVKTKEGTKEIHSSGFPVSKNKKFQLPQRDFLTMNNLPWGLEIEAEKMYITKEHFTFLKSFPEFKPWIESNGKKYKKWFENPDKEYIQ